MCLTGFSPPSPRQVISWANTQTGQCDMASRGGATRPNGPNAGNKICQFKLVLLGESAVGKSSLVLRFVKGQFHEFQESTIGGMLCFHISDQNTEKGNWTVCVIRWIPRRSLWVPGNIGTFCVLQEVSPMSSCSSSGDLMFFQTLAHLIFAKV